MPERSFISIQNISKHFGAVRAVDDVQLEIEKGEFFACWDHPAAARQRCCACWPVSRSPPMARSISMTSRPPPFRISSARSTWCSRTTPSSRISMCSEHRLRPAQGTAAQGVLEQRVERGAGPDQADGFGDQGVRRTVRRTAPADRAGPRPDQEAEGSSAGRAARCA